MSRGKEPVKDLRMWFCDMCGHSDFYEASSHRNEHGYWCQGRLQKLIYVLQGGVR